MDTHDCPSPLHHVLLPGMLSMQEQGLVLLDQQGNIVFWNAWMAAKSGIAAEHAIGAHWLELFPDLASSRIDEAIQTALTHHMPVLITPHLNRSAFPLGSVKQPLQQTIRILPLEDPDGTRYGLIQITDMSSEIQRERLLRETAEQLHGLVRRDPLTGIGNRKLFDDTLEHELARQQRSHQPIGLALLDVDHFKAYNDRYGHEEGDHCLAQVAELLRNALKRTTDVPCRYSGEEFALVLPNTDLAGTLAVAQDIRNRLAGDEPRFRAPITLSIGTTVANPAQPVSADELVARADQALYQAKHDGRDCVRSSAGLGDFNCGTT